MTEATTMELVNECLAGNQQAVSILLNQYGRMAYSVISHLLFAHADVEDVYQDACLRAFSNLAMLRDPASFGGWFKQIAVRTAVDYLRGHRLRFEQLSDRLPDPTPGPEEYALAASTKQQVRLAVGELPEHYRQVIVLYYWSDCSYQEIAAALNIPMGTVMSRLHKAKNLLTRSLDSGQVLTKEGVGQWI